MDLPPPVPALISNSEARFVAMRSIGLPQEQLIFVREKDEVRKGRMLKRVTAWQWNSNPRRFEVWIDSTGLAVMKRDTTPFEYTQGLAKTRFNGNQPFLLTKDSLGRGVLNTPTADVIDALNDFPAGNTVAPVVTTLSGTDFGDGSGYVDEIIPPGVYPDMLRTPNALTPAGEVAWGIEKTFEFYTKFLNLDGIDGRGSKIKAYVHVGWRYPNAFFAGGLCDCMYFGDGTFPNDPGHTQVENLTSIDVVAHELGHGVTEFSSQLDYFGESGGLNEANSDILGKAVEFWVKAGYPDVIPTPTDKAEWTIGANIVVGSNGQKRPMRWLWKPSKDSYSYDYAEGNLFQFDDPHFTSGPLNRWFYYVSVGIDKDADADTRSKYLDNGFYHPIGVDKAVKIWHKANTKWLAFDSEYRDAASASVAVAREMYGEAEAQSVAYGFAAIGVFKLNELPPMINQAFQRGPSIEAGSELLLTGYGFLDSSWFIDDKPLPASSVYVANDLSAIVTIPEGFSSGVLGVRNARGYSAWGIPLTIDQQPRIAYFKASPAAFQEGATVSLEWHVERAAKVKVNGLEVPANARADFKSPTSFTAKLEAWGTSGLYTSETITVELRGLDLDGNGAVDVFDPLTMFEHWDAKGSTDLNGDGKTDEHDLYILLAGLK